LASAWLITGLWQSPNEGPIVVAALFGLFCATAVGIRVTRQAFFVGGKWVSRTCLSHAPFNDPLSKDIPISKFADQGWQLVQHLTSSLCAYLLMTLSAPTKGGRWGWMGALEECWTPCPLNKIPTDGERLYYLVQLAIWMYSSFSQRFLQKKAKDYFVMMGHHVATLALVTGSYLGGNTRIGIVILFVHDISDVAIDLLKMANYAKLADRPAYYIVEFCMVLTLSAWLYFRLYLFPFYIMPATIWGSHDACSDPEHRGDYWNHDPPGMQMWRLANYLLGVLCLMHTWWFYLLCRIVRSALRREDLHKVGEKVYEGGSDDETD